MFTPLMAVTLLLAPIQDAATEGQTADNVREYLYEIESNLYQPQEHGLEALEFDLPVANEMLGEIGTAHVKWAKGSDPIIDVDLADFEIPAAYAAMMPPKEILAQGLPDEITSQAKQLINTLTGRGFSSMLDDYVGTLGGIDGEYVKVELNRKEGAEAPLNSQILFVNGDSLVEKAEATMDSPMEAGATMPVTVDFNWKSVGDGYVLDTQVMTFSFDTPMGNIEQRSTISFDYLEVGDLHLLVGMRTEMKTPMGPQSAEQRIENLLVNGEPVGRDDAGGGEDEG